MDEFVQRQIDKRQQKLDPIKKKIDLITELLLEEKNDSWWKIKTSYIKNIS